MASLLSRDVGESRERKTSVFIDQRKTQPTLDVEAKGVVPKAPGLCAGDGARYFSWFCP
jgi:hypothetical protein